MTPGPAAPLETDRLLLRRWRAADRAPFAALNADPVVMEHFPASLTRVESDAFVDRIDAHFDAHGYGLWAIEVKGGEPFVGFVGLAHATFDAPFNPSVEIGWRLAHGAWGRGIASEAAGRALAHAFGPLALDEVVSFTAVANARSRRVMERIGLARDPRGDFDHPRVVQGSPLRRHVLYRLPRALYLA